MTVLFPTALDSSTFPSAATLTAETLADGPHSLLHDQLGQAILALETKVGINGSANTASLDYLINHIPTALPSGILVPFSGSVAPAGYLLCDGTLVSTTTYAALFAVVGTAFGTGSGTFGLPDLRGRAVIGLDNMGGSAAARVALATSMGQSGGASAHTLSATESGIASHTHTQNSHTHTDSGHQHGTFMWNGTAGSAGNVLQGTVNGGGVGVLAANNTGTGTAVISTSTAVNQNATATAAASSHNNLQPYLALNVLIKT